MTVYARVLIGADQVKSGGGSECYRERVECQASLQAGYQESIAQMQILKRHKYKYKVTTKHLEHKYKNL